MSLTLEGLDSILAKDPNNAEAWRLKGDILLRKTRFYESLKCYTQAIILDQNYSDAWKGKGTVCIFQNNTNDALQCIDRAIFVNDSDAESFRLKSHVYPSNKENAKKINDSINKALELDSNNPKVLFSKALHLKREGLLQESLSYLEMVLSLDPNHLAAQINKLQILNKGKSTVNTIQSISEILKSQKDEVTLLKEIGDNFLLQFELNLANDCYEKILSHVQSDEVLKKKCMISLMKLDLKTALELILLYLNHNPNDSEAWTRKGEILRLQNKIVDAILSFDYAIKADERNAEAWRRKGFAQSMRHEEMSDAIHCLNKSLEIDPYHPMTYVQLARYLLRDKSKWDDSLVQLDKALEIDPTFVLAWKQKGDLLASAKDYELASECYENILKLDPNDAINWYLLGVVKAKNAEKEFQNGLKFLSDSKFEDALSSFNIVLSIDPDDTMALVSKGDILVKMNKIKDGEDCYMKAHELEPDNDSISLRMRNLK